MELVPTKSALGRVAAADVFSGSDSPAFPLSHMDGYAVNSLDAQRRRLKVTGTRGPGSEPRARANRGQAVRVGTGARLPFGTDAVVPLEDARESDGWVTIPSKIERWSYVYPAGADYRKGEQMLNKGYAIRAQDIGLLLNLGIDRIKVFRRPRVALIATGSELSDKRSPPPGKVRNTHSAVFSSLVQANGCAPLDMGVVPDSSDELTRCLAEAFSKADLVLTLGGTSAGEHDLVSEAVASLSPEVLIHGVRMDRGRVAGAGVVRGRPLVMLPGPIQGAMNAFNLLATPTLDRLRGSEKSGLTVRARLGSDWNARDRFKSFTKVVYVRLGGRGNHVAEVVSGETESMTVLTEASGFVVVPEAVSHLSAGHVVDVRLTPGFSFPS